MRYIRQLTKSLDSKEAIYVDLELLAYAIRTMNRPRLSELAMGPIVTIINPIRTAGSFIIGTVGGVLVKVKTTAPLFISSVVFFV